MRNKTHYLNMMNLNRSEIIGTALAASAVYAARYGLCEVRHHCTHEWFEIAQGLKDRHGDNMLADQVLKEMNETVSGARI